MNIDKLKMLYGDRARELEDGAVIIKDGNESRVIINGKIIETKNIIYREESNNRVIKYDYRDKKDKKDKITFRYISRENGLCIDTKKYMSVFMMY